MSKLIFIKTQKKKKKRLNIRVIDGNNYLKN